VDFFDFAFKPCARQGSGISPKHQVNGTASSECFLVLEPRSAVENIDFATKSPSHEADL
jgi:hypothetical protein